MDLCRRRARGFAEHPSEPRALESRSMATQLRYVRLTHVLPLSDRDTLQALAHRQLVGYGGDAGLVLRERRCEPGHAEFILGGTSWAGLVGHLFLHGGFLHLAGNLLFLWVFGNAVCAMTSNLVYRLLYLGFGVLAAAAHLAFDCDPGVRRERCDQRHCRNDVRDLSRNTSDVFWFVLIREVRSRFALGDRSPGHL